MKLKDGQEIDAGLTTAKGLLYAAGAVLTATAADSMARRYGFMYAEQLVHAMEEAAGAPPRKAWGPITAVEEHEDVIRLRWIYDRMVNVHQEKPEYDYMIKFFELIDRMRKGFAAAKQVMAAPPPGTARAAVLTAGHAGCEDRMRCNVCGWSDVRRKLYTMQDDRRQDVAFICPDCRSDRIRFESGMSQAASKPLGGVEGPNTYEPSTAAKAYRKNTEILQWLDAQKLNRFPDTVLTRQEQEYLVDHGCGAEFTMNRDSNRVLVGIGKAPGNLRSHLEVRKMRKAANEFTGAQLEAHCAPKGRDRLLGLTQHVWHGPRKDLDGMLRHWDSQGLKVVCMSVDWADPSLSHVNDGKDAVMMTIPPPYLGRNVLDRNVVVIVRREP